MNRIYSRLFLLMVISFVLNSGYSQSGEIKIRFIGNCGLYATDGISNIYIDFPYKSGAHNYMKYDAAEIDSIKENAVFIFTHRHADHYSAKILKKLEGAKYDPFNIDELDSLNHSIPGFNIKAFETPHKVFGISFKHYSYLITWHQKKIYISGDTENADTLATQQDIDWAFVPVWVISDAIKKGYKLKDRIKNFAIYHVGTKDKITPDKNDERIKLLDKQGEVITILL